MTKDATAKKDKQEVSDALFFDWTVKAKADPDNRYIAGVLYGMYRIRKIVGHEKE